MGLGSSIGGVVSGLINSGRKLPTIDVRALFDTINKAGAEKEKLINQLPANLKPLYEQYKASLGEAGDTLEAKTTDIGQQLLQSTKDLYGPNTDAVKATLAALKTEDYSTLPGTLTNLKAQLAATGGLARGGAGKAITEAVLAPAQQYGQQALNVQAQQLNAQQQNVQAALNKIAAMDEATANTLFGMSTQAAQTILTSGRQDLQNQLADLINNIDTRTSQTLGVQGIQANNAYQNAITRNAQQAAVTNALVNLGVDAGTAFASGGLSNAIPSGTGVPDLSTSTQYKNVANSGTSFPGLLTL
jgi:hypothetical protein